MRLLIHISSFITRIYSYNFYLITFNYLIVLPYIVYQSNNMSNYKVFVEDTSFEIDSNDLQKIDLTNRGDLKHLLHNDKSYQVEVLEIKGKLLRLKINNSTFDIKIADHVDQMVEKMGLNTVKEVVLKDIKAPMPGMILDIMVEAGQQITKGDPILILEAMKMENIIKAEGSGIVKNILLDKGTTVELSLIHI